MGFPFAGQCSIHRNQPILAASFSVLPVFMIRPYTMSHFIGTTGVMVAAFIPLIGYESRVRL
jgi:uncharacterized membrane protein